MKVIQDILRYLEKMDIYKMIDLEVSYNNYIQVLKHAKIYKWFHQEELK